MTYYQPPPQLKVLKVPPTAEILVAGYDRKAARIARVRATNFQDPFQSLLMADTLENAKDPFQLPSAEALREIERKQNQREKAIRDQRRHTSEEDDERTHAAEVIQRNYRGHRDRRALKGFGLDADRRWMEALKDAQYGNVIQPKSRSEKFNRTDSSTQRVRKRWSQAGAVALRAGSDDTSDDEGGEDAEIKRQQKSQREKYAKTMGLEYFLEMVDLKHRYGSNLRRYHQEWMKSDTTENYFFWLDYGAGKNLDLEDRPRKRLDTEQVRYLSREERALYQVRIDAQGRFCWVKDGKPITTSPYFKDSIKGIVPEQENVPTWREVTTGEKQEPSKAETSDASSISSGISTGSVEDSTKYVNEEFHNAKGFSKLNHVSVDSLMNHLLRKTTKKNTWIFVADTSFRLYIGIKQSGAFQHSSFLKGARVSAAGLIKIKRGQIRKISPLSGHYAPPVRNFREFLKSLKAAGADLSHLNVSRSYAVILGLEGYIRVKKRAQSMGQKTKDMLNPEEARKREEAKRDMSKSAQREREVLQKEESARRRMSTSYRLKKKLGFNDKVDEEAESAAVIPEGEPLVRERPQ